VVIINHKHFSALQVAGAMYKYSNENISLKTLAFVNTFFPAIGFT
jgi:hypothetical protein